MAFNNRTSTIESSVSIRQYLTYDTALELLTRASNNIIGNDIYKYLIANNIIHRNDGYIILSELKKSPKYSNPSDIYIIIKIRQKQHNNPSKKIGHITLHLNRTDLNNYIHKGATHIINNRSTTKCTRIIISRRTSVGIDGGLVFSLGSNVYTHPIDYPLPDITNGVLYVLNTYFTPSNQMSITNLIYKHNATEEVIEFAQEILPNRRKYGGTFTRKRMRKMKHVTYKRNI